MAVPPPKGDHLVGNFQTPALPTGIFEVFVFSFAYSLVGIVYEQKRKQRKDVNRKKKGIPIFKHVTVYNPGTFLILPYIRVAYILPKRILALSNGVSKRLRGTARDPKTGPD